MDYDYLIASNADYEKVFIEIYYQGKYVAQINQESGLDNLEIEFPGPGLIDSLIERKIPFNEFLILITEAAQKLKIG
jgi:hypothetical protein